MCLCTLIMSVSYEYNNFRPYFGYTTILLAAALNHVEDSL